MGFVVVAAVVVAVVVEGYLPETLRISFNHFIFAIYVTRQEGIDARNTKYC